MTYAYPVGMSNIKHLWSQSRNFLLGLHFVCVGILGCDVRSSAVHLRGTALN